MDPDKIAAVEALLFAYDKPLNIDKISEVLNTTKGEVMNILKHLQTIYDEKSRGVQLYKIAGGYQLLTKPHLEKYLKRLCTHSFNYSLSRPCLETLAIILYKQPITRADIEAIRGVNAETALKSLIEKNLVKEVGRLDAPGRPILYATTKDCLDYLGIDSLNDLPKIGSIQPGRLKLNKVAGKEG